MPGLHPDIFLPSFMNYPVDHRQDQPCCRQSDCCLKSRKISSAFSIKDGLMADIRRIDKDLRSGIITTFKELPGNISKSIAALNTWIITSLKSVPAKFISGLNGLKTGFLSIPSLIKTAIVSFRAFSVTLLTSPLGWIAVVLNLVAFLANRRGCALATVILYAVSAVLFFMYALFVVPEIILSIIGYVRLKKINDKNRERDERRAAAKAAKKEGVA